MNKLALPALALVLFTSNLLASSLPTWVTAPELENGFASTSCSKTGDSEEKLATMSFASLAEEIGQTTVTFTQTPGNQKRGSTKPEISNKTPSTSESFVSQKIGTLVSATVLSKITGSPNVGQNETIFEHSARVTYISDSLRKVQFYEAINSSQEIETSSFEATENELSWEEVKSLLLRSGEYLFQQDTVKFPDGDDYLCLIVGYKPIN